TAQCAGPGCTAATTGATSGTPGRTQTEARCTAAANGCTVASDATAVTERDSGQTTGKGKNATAVPGASGTAEASSQIDCPEAGCATRTSSTTKAVGAAKVKAKSSATCASAGACQAKTGGFAARQVAEVTGGCVGTGCTTHTVGRARAAAPGGVNKAYARTAC